MNIATVIEGIIQEVKDIKEKPATDEEKKQRLHALAQDTINILQGIVGV